MSIGTPIDTMRRTEDLPVRHIESNAMHDREGELSLRQVLGEALVLSVLFVVSR